jgi:hypothetical protein
MLTIVKSIVTIAMAGTSGHSTLHRWYSATPAGNLIEGPDGSTPQSVRF